jgi:hypothetical protein
MGNLSDIPTVATDTEEVRKVVSFYTGPVELRDAFEICTQEGMAIENIKSVFFDHVHDLFMADVISVQQCGDFYISIVHVGNEFYAKQRQ